MVKKLKEFAIFSGKRYKRGKDIFNRKDSIVKKAKNLRRSGYNVVMDKNSNGHFLWVYEKSKVIKKTFAKKSSNMNSFDRLKSLLNHHKIKYRDNSDEVYDWISVDTTVNSYYSISRRKEKNAKTRIRDRTDWDGDGNFDSVSKTFKEFKAEIESRMR